MLRACVLSCCAFMVLVGCGSPPLTGTGDSGSSSGDDAGSGAGPDAGNPAPDSGSGSGHDAGQPAPDAGSSDGGMGTIPTRGGVSLDGGSVDRLFFSLTGDTRPPLCDLFFLGKGYDYPTANVTKIAQQMEARQPQFALDLGDHMFVCFGGASEAQAQMNAYLSAVADFHAPYFMTMGNHECLFAIGGAIDDCGANNPTDPAFTTFMTALAPVASKPYYAIDIQTSQGLARIIHVADDAWDATESTWLDATMADADTRARYTIVARHHNLSQSTTGNYAAIVKIIQAHKYALHLTAHEHLYQHDVQNDASGRTVIVGTGGSSDETMLGYATVVQGVDGQLYFTMYDSSTDSPIDAWTVGPNL